MDNKFISSGWKRKSTNLSLEEINGSIKIPQNANFWRKLFAFLGPGTLVAVGYVDPGNWSTSLAGGSRYGYSLLSIILISSLLAMFFQEMSARLGIATNMDLAQATRNATGKKTSLFLWVLTELAIIATDIAEVIGSAIALNLLFNLPLVIGVSITTLDVMLLLALQKKGFRLIEALIAVLMLTILLVFLYEVLLSNPDAFSLLSGYIPTHQILFNPDMLFISLGILGATIMPHNLYLHSAIIQTRELKNDLTYQKEFVKFMRIDTFSSLTIAFIINSLILILGASAFHNSHHIIEEIQDVYKYINPTLGVASAGTLFAIALLASGQNSTITGTITGQIVMEGFINLKISPWLRRLITRLVAIIPVLLVTLIYGESGTGKLLLWSQVILSLQLPFCLIPLLLFTSDPKKMGYWKNSLKTKIIGWIASLLIISLNLFLIIYIIFTGNDIG